MDTVIKRISEIEQSAVAVMDDAAARKKAFAAEMEEKTRRFDQTADEETEKEMETRMNLELSGQKAEAEKQLAQMEKNYELHHEAYVKKLFQELIKE